MCWSLATWRSFAARFWVGSAGLTFSHEHRPGVDITAEHGQLFPGASFRAAITSDIWIGYSWPSRLRISSPWHRSAGDDAESSFTGSLPATRRLSVYHTHSAYDPNDIWRSYIRPMGAGAVAAAD